MGGLLPRLIQEGIKDRECLIGLAMLDRTEKRKFLKRDCRLDAFQYRVLRSALKKYTPERVGSPEVVSALVALKHSLVYVAVSSNR